MTIEQAIRDNSNWRIASNIGLYLWLCGAFIFLLFVVTWSVSALLGSVGIWALTIWWCEFYLMRYKEIAQTSSRELLRSKPGETI